MWGATEPISFASLIKLRDVLYFRFSISTTSLGLFCPSQSFDETNRRISCLKIVVFSRHSTQFVAHVENGLEATARDPADRYCGLDTFKIAAEPCASELNGLGTCVQDWSMVTSVRVKRNRQEDKQKQNKSKKSAYYFTVIISCVMCTSWLMWCTEIVPETFRLCHSRFIFEGSALLGCPRPLEL